MKNAIKLFLFVCCLSKAMQAQNNKEVVLFDYGQFALTTAAQSKLDIALAKINVSQLKSVELYGHTDTDGKSDYNVTLSKNRVNTVSNYLVSKGIPTAKIKLTFDGENNPVTENASEKGKQQNRRVELTFAFEEKEVANTIFDKLKKESQFFTAKSNLPIAITGKEGTVITIPKNALLKANGKYAVGKITIELKEFYKKSDMVIGNLHTMSDENLLESGGMIFIKATCNGEEVQLKKGTEMTIAFASKSDSSGMEIFYGNPDGSGINWSNKKKLETLSKGQNDTEAYFISAGEEYDIVAVDTLSSEATNVPKKNLKETNAKIRQANAVNRVLQSTKLGWINCDRFYEVADKTNLLVNIDLKFKPEIRLVFKDINGMMPGYSFQNKTVFRNIPVGKKATLIAFTCVEDETFFSMQDIIINKDKPIDITLQKTTLEEFKTELLKLN